MAELVLVFLAVVYVATAWRIGLRSVRTVITHPLSLFFLATAFIHFLMPVLQGIYGIQRYPGSYSVESSIISTLLPLLYTAGVWIGFRSITKGTPDWQNFSLASAGPQERRAMLIVIGIPSSIALIYLAATIFALDIERYLQDRIYIRRGLGPLILIAFMAILFVAYEVIAFYSRRVRSALDAPRKIALTGLVVIAAVLYALMGNRLYGFILLVLILISYCLYYRVSLRSVGIATIGLATIAFAFSAWAVIRVQFSGDWLAIVADEQSLIVRGLSGAFGNAENLRWLYENSSRWDLLYGKSFIAGFINLIPRGLWPEKPFGGGPELRNMIFPGSYTIEGVNLTSYTTGIIIESYMNFGVVGLLFVGAINGLSMGALWRWFNSGRPVSPIAALIYVWLLFMISFGFLFMEFLGGWTRVLVCTIPLFLIYWFTRSPLALRTNTGRKPLTRLRRL